MVFSPLNNFMVWSNLDIEIFQTFSFFKLNKIMLYSQMVLDNYSLGWWYVLSEKFLVTTAWQQSFTWLFKGNWKRLGYIEILQYKYVVKPILVILLTPGLTQQIHSGPYFILCYCWASDILFLKDSEKNVFVTTIVTEGLDWI